MTMMTVFAEVQLGYSHFGGAIGGYLITLIKEPSMFNDNLPMVGLLAVPIIILFVMTKMGKL